MKGEYGVKYRTFGWVQNPSNFDNLKKTVQVFDPTSNHYKNLQDHIVNEVIYFPEDKNKFQDALDDHVCEFSYKYLVGSKIDKNRKSPKSRKDSVANSLLQISILPQSAKTKGRLYTDNWTADGFLRWAVSLNFLSHNRVTDTFKITSLGKKYSASENGSIEERNILREAMLSYPPASRVMTLLADSKKPMTKFAIGKQLGFVGEGGFTSYDEDLMIDWIKNVNSANEAKKIRTDIEGTSDKYARMICGWLIKLNYVKKRATKYINSADEQITGFQEYSLTGEGLHAINKANGSSKNKSRSKFIMWEFFATEGPRNSEQSREFIRTRRAYTLKSLKHHHTLSSILEFLKRYGIYEEQETLLADLHKLITFGIRISIKGNSIKLLDTINDFSIPNQTFTLAEADVTSEKIKNHFRRVTKLPERYLELLDIAFDSKRNRDFEIVTAGLFKEIYGLESIHLGGANKPDGVIYSDKFGIILDTKAYEKGYGKHISQIDEMVRYIEDNRLRDTTRNPNKWWEKFGENIPEDNFYYLWVSGKFLPSFSEQLMQTNYRTNVNGGGLEVKQLLLGADAVQKKKLDINSLPNYMDNKVIKLVPQLEEIS